MGPKKWLLLPFEGASWSQKEKLEDNHRSSRKFDGNEGFAKHESAADFAAKDESQIVQDYNAPIHWYMMATIFPLVAGTFGPMASAFNICAVAINWRLIVDPSSKEATGQHIQDPTWLVAVNGVSLAIAIIANLALFGQMTRRLRFSISAPTVIVGWFVSGIILVGLVAAAPSHVPLPDNPMATYSQAYYYAIFAGAIYILLSLMLTTTAYGIFIGHYASGFKLSLSQRSLMLQTILFLAYVLAAGAVYCRIEGWNYLDAVYYIVVTLFTIGFGDLTPETHLGRSLYFPMAVGGIVFVGLIIANIRTLVIESGSVKVSTRLVEKARFKTLKNGDLPNGIVKVRGTQVRSINAETELERRKMEFQVMREVQAVAALNQRLLALFLATTAFLILWFIGAICFWQAEKGQGGQNWSYFEALYFTYTAQLTIGYGDFEPQTNSGKPTFVFWALIALPTLTVLIGAVGDAVTDSVNWALVWFPEHTPDLVRFLKTGPHWKRGKTDAIKEVIKKAEQLDTEEKGFHDIGAIKDGKVVPSDTPLFGLVDPKTVEDAYRPHLIVQTAQKVLSHLDEDKPRKYTYEEWTWLLTLLGEDESTPEGHRIIGQPVAAGMTVATPLRSSKTQAWSWMGQESPLMSLQDDSEPKWVLKRLMEVQERDLKKRGDRHVANEINKA